jgi:hypothetical protein
MFYQLRKTLEHCRENFRKPVYLEIWKRSWILRVAGVSSMEKEKEERRKKIGPTL